MAASERKNNCSFISYKIEGEWEQGTLKIKFPL